MIKGTTVLVKKLKEAPDAKVGSCPMEKWIPGVGPAGEEDLSLPIDYSLVGELLNDIEYGKPIRVARRIRNGVETPGEFVTSTLKAIDITAEGGVVCTQNSVYAITCMFT